MKMRLLVSLVVLGLLLSVAGECAVIRVSTSGDDASDGSTWALAKKTVTAALGVSVSGDEIWVAAGTYVERITLKDGVGLYGGFAGAETARSLRNWRTSVTILDGGQAGSVVTASNGVTSSACVDGFTIRNGKASSGAGIYCNGSSCVIRNNTIVSNGASNDGGGVYCINSSPSITGNTIANNTSSRGGGVLCLSPALIENNIIRGNSATSSYGGGGIYCYFDASPLISGNLIVANKASRAAGICCDSASPTITNNTIAANGYSQGAGIGCYSSSSPVISNNIVALNCLGIYKDSKCTGTPVLRNNNVHNPGALDYSGLAAGAGDISADPKFASVEYGDYHIQPDSPCIGAGWDGASGIGTTDIDQQPRVLPSGGMLDIGADESDGTTWSVTPAIVRVDGANGNDSNDGSSWTSAKKTIQSGIDTASGLGGEVWVKAGTYTGNITLRANAYLYGGFAGTESSKDGRDWVTNRTSIVGGTTGTVVEATNIIGQRGIIDGFSITGAEYGIYCSNASLEIRDNIITFCPQGGIVCTNSSSLSIITGNTIADNGVHGGIYSAVPVVISNNTISGNTSTDKGGGIYCVGSATITNNTIRGNSGNGYGGGIYCSGSVPVTIANNIIAGNGATCGGAVSCSNCSPIITNNTMVGNFCGYGAISCLDGASPAISNNIVAFNSFGIYSKGTGVPVLRNNNVHNPDGADYSGLSAGIGDISLDPKLASTRYGSYHIQPDSPCVDAGWNEAPEVGTSDIDGQPRIRGGQVDIGADESDGTIWSVMPQTVRVDGVNGDDGNDGSTWGSAKKTIQAAIDTASVTGGDVWVKAGVYVGPVILKACAYLYGGFAGDETALDARNWAANVTTLDGGGVTNVLVTASNTGSRLSAIDGFTIRNSKGSGIYCYSASPIISNNTVTQTQGMSLAGILCNGASPLISNNLIHGNAGYGLSCTGGAPIVTNNTIVAHSGGSAAGARFSSSSPVLCNNIVALNTRGVSCTGGSPVLRNNLVYNPNGSNYDGCSAGVGDIVADPGFAGYRTGNYHIQPDSPCVDAGWNAAPGALSTDIDCQPRDGVVDIGADESDGTAWPAPPVPVVHVDGDNGNDANDGSTWALAKKTVQAAIDTASASYGEVWVKAGVYSERIALKADVHVFGGFSGVEFAKAERNWSANVTVLDGGGTGSTVTASGITWPGATVDGFAIRNGKAQNGGGVSVSYSTVTISNNSITANTATNNGGGIYLTGGCNAIISGNTVTGNASAYGGGVYCWCGSGTIVISNNVVSANTVTQQGGGIYAAPGQSPSSSKFLVTNNTISGNVSAANGGGVYFSTWANASLSGNIIAGNTAASGGGLYCGSCSPSVTNNTFARNGGGGIYLQSASPAISNNVIAHNTYGLAGTGSTPTLRNNDVYNPGCPDYSGVTAGATDISVAPKFASLQSGNWHIQPDSPCVDTGWNGAPGIGPKDMDGQPRFQPLGGSIDIGADESDGTAWNIPPAPAVHVDGQSGDDSNDGLSWESPKKTVQAGINAASVSGNEVWVKAGVYRERVSLRTFADVYGGFAGNETSRDARNWSANKTTLDGEALGSVVTVSGVGFGVTIDGFTICNGSSPTYGGGIYCSRSSLIVANCSIISNSGTYGGSGVYATESTCRMANNTVRSNPTAALSFFNTTATLSNNTVVGNPGTAILVQMGPANISNNIVAFNAVGIQLSSSGFPLLLRNNNVYNPGGTNYRNISAGQGDISADPKFVGWQYGGVHIQADSPCRDAGWNDAPGIPAVDVDGELRILSAGGAVDIGADEFDGHVDEVVPAIVRVDGVAGDDSNDGSSWASAKKTLQSAVNAVSALGGEVWVKSGTYVGSLTLKPCVHLYGGFAGTETVRAARDWTVNPTVLDGNAAGTVVTASNINLGQAAVDGFTIRNGKTTGNGGGVACNSAAVTISNNIIKSNVAGYGGGVYCNKSPGLIANNRIISNTASLGGGIYCTSSAAVICNNTIASNTNTYAHGGGILCTMSSAVVSNNVVAFNSSGAALSSGSPTVRNNVIYNPAGSNYFGTMPASNLVVNPLFCDLPAGDYHLQAKSPCINAGWNEAQGLGAADMDGEARIYGSAVDIGADEYAGVPLDFVGVRTLDEGTTVSGYRALVAAALPGVFYLEADDRTSGVRVEMPGHALQVGMRANVDGAVRTNANGERCIVATSATTNGTGSVLPFFLSNAALGGGALGYQDAVWGWQLVSPAPGDKPVRTWAKASGLNNIGLLIRTTGKVAPELTTPTSFTIDDGSGVRIKCIVPAGVAIDPAWSYVSVTGVSSCEKVTVAGGTELRSVVLIRSASDIAAIP